VKRAHRLPHYKRGRERKRRLIWLPRRHSLPSARNNTFLFPWLSSDLFCLGGKKREREREGERERRGERERERRQPHNNAGLCLAPAYPLPSLRKFGVSGEWEDERDKLQSCQRS